MIDVIERSEEIERLLDSAKRKSASLKREMGAAIKKIRNEKGYTQRELGKLMAPEFSLSAVSFCNMESETKASLHSHETLREVLRFTRALPANWEVEA